MAQPSPTKPIVLPCTLELTSRIGYKGETRDLSMLEATVNLPSLCFPGSKPPKFGATGVLSVSLRGGGIREVMKIPCRIDYVSTTQVGLTLRSQALNTRQQKVFEAALSFLRGEGL